MEEDEKITRLDVAIYILSIVFFVLGFLPVINEIKIILYVISALLGGYSVLIDGIKDLVHLKFSEETLMTIAVIAAFASGSYIEGCIVILLYQLGEYLNVIAIKNSNKSIQNIVDIKEDKTNLIVDGEIKEVDTNDVKVGDIILVKPGENFPLDVKILNGESEIDNSNLTGESRRILVIPGEEVLSGSININGKLECEVLRDYDNSTASQIVKLVEEARENKGKVEDVIDKFAKIYTPIIILLSILIVVIPVYVLHIGTLSDWIYKALVFLVAGCPCSIVISVPLAFFSCIGSISKKGMLIKGTKHIESLAKSKAIVFDKTGTITTGQMEIESFVVEEDFVEEDVLNYMYNVEKNSNHPISTAIIKLAEDEDIIENLEVEKYEEIPGYGIYAELEGKGIQFGNLKLLDKYGIPYDKEKFENINANFFAIDGKVAGYVILKEELRKEVTPEYVERLNKMGLKKIAISTGDSKENTEVIANDLGVFEVYSNLLPEEKLEKVEMLKKYGKVIFIGDGINDGPVLAASDFGIAMGSGSEIANSVADGILISNNLLEIPEIIKTARKTINVVKFNIFLSIVVKLIVIILGAFDIAEMWMAVVADMGVSLITIINALRIIRYGRINNERRDNEEREYSEETEESSDAEN